MTSHNLRMKSKRRQWPQPKVAVCRVCPHPVSRHPQRRHRLSLHDPLPSGCLDCDDMWRAIWRQSFIVHPPHPFEQRGILDSPLWSRLEDATPIANIRKAAENSVVASTSYAMPPDFPTAESENE